MKRAMVRLETLMDVPHITTEAVQAIEQALHEALSVANMIRFMPFEVILWQAQNIWNDLLRRIEGQHGR